jgi:hypothetical protein
MALLSPGVEVTVVDQSQYIPAAVNSVPYILLATAQNKVSGTGVGVAAGTLKANANKVYLITSQRDLSATYGVPFFYKTTAGTPINGYELNEYGLLAAYSALGITNRAYIQRVDVDLAALTASLTRPTGTPPNGTYWLDTANSLWGLYQWNLTTSAFTNVIPMVITDSAQLEGDSTVPLQSIGSIGDYAITSTNVNNPGYFKRGGPTADQTSAAELSDYYNTWVEVGSGDWQTAWPTVQGTLAPTTVTAGTFKINSQTITVNSGDSVANVSNAINSANIAGVYSAYVDSKLQIYSNNNALGADLAVTGASGNGTVATLTFSTQTYTSYDVGSTINVVGLTSTGAAYNGTHVVTACGNTSVSFASTVTAAYVSGGTIQQPGGVLVLSASGTPLTSLGINQGGYYAPTFLAAPNYSAPRWRSTDTIPEPTGSVWQRTNSVNLGANLSVKKYSTLLGTYVQQTCNIYSDSSEASYTLDPSGGGKNIVAGTTIAITNPEYNSPATLGLEIFERYSAGSTVVTGSTTTPGSFTSGNTFTIQATVPGQAALGAAVTATLAGTTVADFLTAVSAAVGSSTFASYVSASVNSSGAIVFTHSAGGNIVLKNTAGTPLTTAGFTAATTFCRAGANSSLILSYWVGTPTFTYTASNTGPDQDPANGTYWYYSATTQADIMIQNNGAWYGYQNVSNDVRGDDLTQTNASGPIFSTTAPTTQNNTAQSPLVYGDLWINTSDLENYPVINRWSNIEGVDQWVTINNTDQTTQNGILFADARWSPNGLANPVTDALPTITSLLTSNYLDLDAPDPALYPQGTLLWNTRRSGFNVKTFEGDYFNTTDFYVPVYSSTTKYAYNDFVNYNGTIYVCLTTPPTAGIAPSNTTYWSALDMANGGVNTWVNASGNRNDGSPYMGRLAQRAIIVAALKSGIDSSVQAREEQRQFNLIACPQYPELMSNMVELNNDRKNTAFVIGDTPLRLGPDSTSLTAWHSNNSGAGLPTGDGQISYDTYLGVFYPSCQTTDLSGSPVVQPPSHMMIRTIIRSDEISYPWLAPAGTLRGVIDNAALLGYVNGQTGEFTTIGVSQTLRDVLYQLDINPITFIPGIGITNFGNKTATNSATALDRINVARLVAFIRGRLTEIGNQYLFEPNDQITRNQISNSVTSLMLDLVAKRGIYDYLVVCDTSNNTPATIDANELYVDIAIEPVKAVEFIYIPLRIQNTGTISSSISTVATAG